MTPSPKAIAMIGKGTTSAQYGPTRRVAPRRAEPAVPFDAPERECPTCHVSFKTNRDGSLRHHGPRGQPRCAGDGANRG